MYSFGIVITVKANIGYAPWDIFHAGLSKTTGLSFGTISIIVGALIVTVLAILGEKFGLATVLNILLIGIFLDIIFKFNLIPIAPNRVTGIIMMVAGLFVISLGTYFYIKSALGVGPRDNLMVVLAKKTKIPVGVCRFLIELSVALVGWKLGGMLWFGSILFAIVIGFCIQITFWLFKFDVTAVKHESIAHTFNALFRRH